MCSIQPCTNADGSYCACVSDDMCGKGFPCDNGHCSGPPTKSPTVTPTISRSPTLSPTATKYITISSGYCTDYGRTHIDNEAECRLASRSLGSDKWTALFVNCENALFCKNRPRAPPGCTLLIFNGNFSDDPFLLLHESDNTGECTTDEICFCKSL